MVLKNDCAYEYASIRCKFSGSKYNSSINLYLFREYSQAIHLAGLSSIWGGLGLDEGANDRADARQSLKLRNLGKYPELDAPHAFAALAGSCA